MKLLSKDGTTFKILAFPGESVCKGEYLVITDREKSISYLVQIIDVNYADIPGLIEELVREGLIDNDSDNHMDTIGFYDMLSALRDVKILDCEFRGVFLGDRIIRRMIDLPSRSKADIRKISSSAILNTVLNNSTRRIWIGKDLEGHDICINAEDLDGCLNLITGMKGTGKSHLAKLLVSELVKKGAPVLVFDLNGEYIGLAKQPESKIDVYFPGDNLFFSLEYLGKNIVIDILSTVLLLPEVSSNLFSEIWDFVEKRGEVTIKSLMDSVLSSTNNIMIREALITRLNILAHSGFITDEKTNRIEGLIRPGRASIIVLRDLSPTGRKILVEIILSKLVSGLLRNTIPPLFLFAEEAHLYVRETYWEDIITRMRHFGLFVTFITNQLDSLSTEVFKQLDNVFLFCFKNDSDLEKISKISDVDSKTIKNMVKELPQGTCLAIGKVVSSLPLIIQVRDLKEEAMGETRYVFSNLSQA